MNHRVIGVLAAILALAISPFLFLMIAISTPRFPWSWVPALFLMVVVGLISALLPLPNWRYKAFTSLIPLFGLVLSTSVSPGTWIAASFVGLTILHPTFIAMGQPSWNLPIESGLWGLLLTLLCLWVLAGPAYMIYIWLLDLWRPGMMFSVFDELSLILVVLTAIVSCLVYLRTLSASVLDAPNKSLNTDAGKAGAG